MAIPDGHLTLLCGSRGLIVCAIVQYEALLILKSQY
jgi:hypothetical protein